MTNNWNWQEESDLRLLATIAMSACRKGQFDGELEAVFQAWRAHHPTDALGAVGMAMFWFAAGRRDEAIELLQKEVETAETRADQAMICLQDLCEFAGRPVPSGLKALAPSVDRPVR